MKQNWTRLLFPKWRPRRHRTLWLRGPFAQFAAHFRRRSDDVPAGSGATGHGRPTRPAGPQSPDAGRLLQRRTARRRAAGPRRHRRRLFRLRHLQSTSRETLSLQHMDQFCPIPSNLSTDPDRSMPPFCARVPLIWASALLPRFIRFVSICLYLSFYM